MREKEKTELLAEIVCLFGWIERKNVLAQWIPLIQLQQIKQTQSARQLVQSSPASKLQSFFLPSFFSRQLNKNESDFFPCCWTELKSRLI